MHSCASIVLLVSVLCKSLMCTCSLQRPTVDNHFQQALTAEQRRMRADTLRRTMQLLEHAAVCNNRDCQSKSCHKVKQLHAHSKQCNKRMTGNCNFCRHLWCLLGLHAKRCTKDNCPVPRCKCASSVVLLCTHRCIMLPCSGCWVCD